MQSELALASGAELFLLRKSMNLTDELRNLSELHREGNLTDQEFSDAKQRLIKESRIQPAPPGDCPKGGPNQWDRLRNDTERKPPIQLSQGRLTSVDKTLRETHIIVIPPDLKNQIPEAVQRKLATMEKVNQVAFLAEFRKRKKSPALALWLLLPLGLHYAYIGKWWLTFIFCLTLGGVGLWWVIDFFRTVGMVREHNKTIAISVLRDIQISD